MTDPSRPEVRSIAEYATESLRFGFRYIRPDDRFLTTVLLGVVVLNFAQFVLPLVLFFGYLFRVLRGVLERRNRPPGFTDWQSLSVNGSRATFIAFVYVVSPVTIVDLFVRGTTGVGLAQITGWVRAAQTTVGTGLVPTGETSATRLATVLLVFYLFPAALAHFAMAEDQRIKDGLAVEAVFTTVTDRRYAIAWTIAFTCFVVGLSATVLPTFFPLDPEGQTVGNETIFALLGIFGFNLLLLLGYAIFFVLQVAAYAIVGRAWLDIHGGVRDELPRVRGGGWTDTTIDHWNRRAANERMDEHPPAKGWTERMNRALRYPLRSSVAARTAVLGGFIVLLGNILFPMILVGGYLARVLRRGIRGRRRPPRFEGWRGLLGDGARALVTWTIFAAVPLLLVDLWIADGEFRTELVGVLLPGTIFGGFATLPTQVMLPDRSLAGVVRDMPVARSYGILVFGFLLLGTLYVLPAALANCARTRRFTDAFGVRSFWRLLLSRTYAVGWTVAFGVSLIGWLLVAALALVPGVPAPTALDEGATGQRGQSLAALFAEGSGFEYPLSFGIFPTYRVVAPETVVLYAVLFGGTVAFFYLQIAAFYLIGRVWERTATSIDAESLRTCPASGRSSGWFSPSRLARVVSPRCAGSVSGAVLVAFALAQTNPIGPFLPPTHEGLVVSLGLMLTAGLITLAMPLALCLLFPAMYAVYERYRTSIGMAGSAGLLVASYGLLVWIVVTMWNSWVVATLAANFDAILALSLNLGLGLVESGLYEQGLAVQLIAWILIAAGSAMLGIALVRTSDAPRAGAVLLFVTALPIAQFLLLFFVDVDVFPWLEQSFPASFVLFGLAWIVLSRSIEPGRRSGDGETNGKDESTPCRRQFRGGRPSCLPVIIVGLLVLIGASVVVAVALLNVPQIEPGEQIRGELGPQGEGGMYRFEATADEYAHVEFAREGGSGEFDVYLTDVDQNVLAAEQVGPGDGARLSAQVNMTGTYNVHVMPAGGTGREHDIPSGPYSMTVETTEDASSAPSPNVTQLRHGDSAAGEIVDAADTDLYSIRAEASEAIRMELDRTEGEGRLTYGVFAPDGTYLGEVYADVSELSEFVASAEQSGEYVVVVVGDPETEGSGPYEITATTEPIRTGGDTNASVTSNVSLFDVIALEPGRVVGAELGVENDTDAFTLEAKANESVRVELERIEGQGSFGYVIVAPNGTLHPGEYVEGDGRSEFEFVAEESGTYGVFVRNTNVSNGTGAYEISASTGEAVANDSSGTDRVRAPPSIETNRTGRAYVSRLFPAEQLALESVSRIWSQ